MVSNSRGNVVQPKPVHRDQDRLPAWLQRCKAIFKGRALAVTIPLALTLAFGIFCSLNQTPLLNKDINHDASLTEQKQSNTADPLPKLTPGNSAADSSGQTETPDPGSPDSSLSQPNATPAQSTVNQIADTVLPTCNLALKNLADSSERAAIAAENLRHSKAVNQINVTNILNVLLQKTDLSAETALHDLNLQKITDTYNQKLKAADC